MSNDDNQVTRDRLKIIVRHATHGQDEVIFLLIHELWYRGTVYCFLFTVKVSRFSQITS